MHRVSGAGLPGRRAALGAAESGSSRRGRGGASASGRRAAPHALWGPCTTHHHPRPRDPWACGATHQARETLSCATAPGGHGDEEPRSLRSVNNTSCRGALGWSGLSAAAAPCRAQAPWDASSPCKRAHLRAAAGTAPGASQGAAAAAAPVTRRRRQQNAWLYEHLKAKASGAAPVTATVTARSKRHPIRPVR